MAISGIDRPGAGLPARRAAEYVQFRHVLLWRLVPVCHRPDGIATHRAHCVLAATAELPRLDERHAGRRAGPCRAPPTTYVAPPQPFLEARRSLMEPESAQLVFPLPFDSSEFFFSLVSEQEIFFGCHSARASCFSFRRRSRSSRCLIDGPAMEAGRPGLATAKRGRRDRERP